MSPNGHRFVLLALVTIWIATLASGTAPGEAVGAPSVQAKIGSDSPDPTVRLTFERRNFTPANATSFVVSVGNPPDSERPTYVMVLLQVHVSDGDLPVIVGGQPGLEVGGTLVWQYNFDLDPGEYWLRYGAVGRNADPGEYDVEVNATYWKEQGFTSRTQSDRLVVEALTTGSGGGDSGGIVDAVVVLVVERPEVIVAVAAVLGLLISLVESDRTWAAVRWFWRWTNAALRRVTRWAFRDERR